MRTSIGISGMGRIGRLLLRRAFETGTPSIDIRVINSVYPVETVAHLLKYDTVHGRWNQAVSVENNLLIINGRQIQVVMERDPAKIPWKRFGVDIVIDATGQFNHRQGASQHLASGASTVIVTAPANDLDATIVMGVNDDQYDPQKHQLVSAASCTTNCLAPLLKILDHAFGVKSGWMTTIHAYTNDQNHLDNPHKDLRRARACTQSMIPTTTGVQKALSNVLPHLSPVIQGISVRVPTQDVSLVDLTVELKKNVTTNEVKAAFATAIAGKFGPYVEYCEIPLVSSDFIGHDKSTIVDGTSLMTVHNQLKVLAWYDNEWGYASRVVDLAKHISQIQQERMGRECAELLV